MTPWLDASLHKFVFNSDTKGAVHVKFLIAILIALPASAATIIVPAAGTGPGANGSHWQSELTLHNTGAAATTATLRFHDSSGAQQTSDVTINARSTITINDIVNTRFGRESGTGAIEITVSDAAANRLAITSRTFNSSASGQFGQDIPAVNVNDAAAAGDVVVLQAPSSAADARFNFGLYAVTDTKIRWDLVRADGTVVSPLAEQSYAAGTQFQFNQGISNLLGQTEQDNDAVHAVVTSGKVIAYGSAVQNASGDPSFVPGIRVRADVKENFVGVDLDENGTVDVFDADHDGVLDRPGRVFAQVVAEPSMPDRERLRVEIEQILDRPSEMRVGGLGRVSAEGHRREDAQHDHLHASTCSHRRSLPAGFVTTLPEGQGRCQSADPEKSATWDSSRLSNRCRRFGSVRGSTTVRRGDDGAMAGSRPRAACPSRRRGARRARDDAERRTR